jgi:hypothetical protein
VSRRLIGILVVALAVASTASGCGKKAESAALQVRNAMRSTARLSRGVVYTESTNASVVEVRSRVQDDLRYKSSVTLDGTRVLDEVVVDDSLADRILDVRAYKLLGGGVPTGAPALGGWVLDRYGAPSLLPSDVSSLRVGQDIVLDALTVFRHVDLAMNDCANVHRFDPDSLAYRPREDPFPRPDRGAGEVRYDCERPALPRPSSGAGNAARVVPGPQHFRKLAVYVNHGRVTRILEQVDVAPSLRDLERIYNLGLGSGGSTAERAARALAVLNQARRVTGGEAIRPRTLDVELTDLGRAVTVELPAGAVEGNLSGLPHRGDREGRRA